MNCNHYQELIALHIENDLPEMETKNLQLHLSECASCTAFMKEMKDSQSALKNLETDSSTDFAMAAIRSRVMSEISKPKSRFFGSLLLRPVLAVALMAGISFAGILAISKMTRENGSQSRINAYEQKEQAPAQIEKSPVQTQTFEVKPVEESSAQTQITESAVEQTKSTPTLSIKQEAGSVSGVVVDDKGRPLPGTDVELQSASVNRTATTDAHGRFAFGNLSEGEYSLNLRLEGFTEVQYAKLVVSENEPVQLTTTLRNGTVEEFTVLGETAVINSRKTGSPDALNREYLEEIPSADKASSLNYDGVQTAEEPIQSSPTPPAPSPVMPSPPPILAPAPPAMMPPAEAPPTEAPPTVAPPSAARIIVTAPDTVSGSAPSISSKPTEGGQSSGTLGNIPNSGKPQLLVIAADKNTHAFGTDFASQGTLRAQNSKGEVFGEFPLKRTNVNAEISGFMARTEVEQIYTNSFSEVIEAVYVFPLPSLAAVHDFQMEIGDRKIVGVVRPREEAERIYRQARESGQTASLLTQERSNIFTQNVANIEPGGKVTIKIVYFEQLSFERGTYQYIFPMVVGPRYIPGNTNQPDQRKEPGGGWSAATDQVPDADRITPSVLKPGQRSGHDISLSLKIDAGFPIHDLKCVTHDVTIKQDGDSQRFIKLKKKDSIPNRDFVLTWNVAGQNTQFAVLAHKTKKDGYFTLMIQPPIDPADSQVTPREITFILDTSGSMNGIPVEMSKEIVRRTLDTLRPEDAFNIFYFAGGNGQLWNSPQPNTPENVAAARQFLQALRGSGGTEMLAGVKRALNANHDSKYLQMYVFLTDGYVGNEDAILATIKDERKDARFFAFGIGSSVNRYLIDGIGKFGGGTSQVVLPRDRDHAENAVSSFFESIDSPVLVDIRLDWNGLPLRETYPAKINDLFAGRAIWIVGKYENEVNGKAFLRSRVGSREVEYEIPVRLPGKESRNKALSAIWARQKIQSLSEMMINETREDARQVLIERITAIAIDHKLVSQFTSFVAVDESRIVGDGRPVKVLQPVELPESVNYAGIFGESLSGSAIRVNAWGMTLQQTISGKIWVAELDENGIAARSGIRPGVVLKAVNNILIHDFKHLEGVLLQSRGPNVSLRFEPELTIMLPVP